MANGTNTNPYLGTGTIGTPIDPAKILQTSADRAATLREPVKTDDYGGAYNLYKAVKKTGDKVQRGAARSLITESQNQIRDLQKQKERAAQAEEIYGAGAAQYQQRLSDIQQQTSLGYQSSLDSFSLASDQAELYAENAELVRVPKMLERLDKINEQMSRDRDFSQAHAMQAGAQAVLGSMKDAERSILQEYGATSKEHSQFIQSKRVSLATMQSNIYNNYQQLAEKQHQTYLMATNEAQYKGYMYSSFQEQQHVEMLKFQAESKNDYIMKQAQFDIGVEQLRMEGMEDYANWTLSTPTFTWSATPLIGALLAVSQSSKPGFWEQLGTAAMGGISGGLTGGIAGGIAGGLTKKIAGKKDKNKPARTKVYG